MRTLEQALKEEDERRPKPHVCWGMRVPARYGQRPSNTWLFENARCVECGKLRWGP